MNGEEIVGRAESQIKLNEFPLIMSMSGKYGVPIFQDYRSLFNVDISYVNTGPKGELRFENYYGFSHCEVEQFPENTKELVSKIITGIKSNSWSPLCLLHKGKEEYEIGNKFSFSDSSGVFFRITDCNEELREISNYANKDQDVYKSAPKCDPNRREISNSFVLKMELVNSFYNFKSYKNPIHNYAYSFINILGYGITNSAIMHIGIEKLISDNGWLFESLVESQILYYDTWENSTFMMSSDKEIFMIGLGVSNKIKKSYRTYMKVQELFAKVGGLFNAFFLIIKFVLYDYVRYKFHVKYAKYTIDALDLEKNKEMYPEINTFKKYFYTSSKNISIPKDNMGQINKENKIKDNLSLVKIHADDNYNNINNNINENSGNINYNNIENENKDYVNPLQKIRNDNRFFEKSKKTCESISVQPMLNNQTITNDNNVFSEINNSNANINKVKNNNFINHIDKKIKLQPKLNISNIQKSNEKENINPIKKADTLVNLKFKDENNLIKLNNFLLEKVISMKYCYYLFYSLCGCFYKQKPISYLILNSEYSKDKYSMKYYLKHNKKLRSFQRSLQNEKSREMKSINVSQFD